LRPGVGTLRLFGAIMAGYLVAILIPFGFGTVARSWLVARREELGFAAVLGTVVLDRLTDGFVFACLVPVALISVAMPPDAAESGHIRVALAWGGAVSFALFAFLVVGLAVYRRDARRADGRIAQALDRALPARWALRARSAAAALAEGTVWPAARWRLASILLASVAMKLIAATIFLWAGLSIGFALQAPEYLFLLVFIGFLVILGHFARISGSFIAGAVFALGLLGVPPEEALAAALVVEASNILSVAVVGAISLWRQGVALGELQAIAAAMPSASAGR
jgi:uncharacterized membrane protein YbhN (UPF0104 family)